MDYFGGPFLLVMVFRKILLSRKGEDLVAVLGLTHNVYDVSIGFKFVVQGLSGGLAGQSAFSFRAGWWC